MTDELSPTQALALWGLLARQGRAAEKDVKTADRTALIAAKLVETDKPSKTVSLTDRGWNWADTHFELALPPAQRPLQDLLARLGAHLKASSETLAEFIGEAPPPPAPVAKQRPVKAKAPAKDKVPPKSKVEPKPKAPLKPKAPTAAALRARIEEAYLRASGGARSKLVRLSQVRAELGDLDRKTVDIGLGRILNGKKEKAKLTQIDDNKAIDSAEHEAAFSPAGEPLHLLWIP